MDKRLKMREKNTLCFQLCKNIEEEMSSRGIMEAEEMLLPILHKSKVLYIRPQIDIQRKRCRFNLENALVFIGL